MYRNSPRIAANEVIYIRLFDLTDGMGSEQACEAEIEVLRSCRISPGAITYVYILVCGFQPFCRVSCLLYVCYVFTYS
jgi:hypothetical protein